METEQGRVGSGIGLCDSQNVAGAENNLCLIAVPLAGTDKNLLSFNGYRGCNPRKIWYDSRVS